MSKLSTKLGDITFRAFFLYLFSLMWRLNAFVFVLNTREEQCLLYFPREFFFEESFRVPKNRLLLIAHTHRARQDDCDEKQSKIQEKHVKMHVILQEKRVKMHVILQEKRVKMHTILQKKRVLLLHNSKKSSTFAAFLKE